MNSDTDVCNSIGIRSTLLSAAIDKDGLTDWDWSDIALVLAGIALPKDNSLALIDDQCCEEPSVYTMKLANLDSTTTSIGRVMTLPTRESVLGLWHDTPVKSVDISPNSRLDSADRSYHRHSQDEMPESECYDRHLHTDGHDDHERLFWTTSALPPHSPPSRLRPEAVVIGDERYTAVAPPIKSILSCSSSIMTSCESTRSKRTPRSVTFSDLPTIHYNHYDESDNPVFRNVKKPGIFRRTICWLRRPKVNDAPWPSSCRPVISGPLPLYSKVPHRPRARSIYRTRRPKMRFFGGMLKCGSF